MHFHRESIECSWFYELLYLLLGKKDFLLWPSYGKIVFKIVYWSVSWIPIRNCLAADTPGSNQSWLLQPNIQRSADDFPYLFTWCHLLFVHVCDSTDEVHHQVCGNCFCMFDSCSQSSSWTDTLSFSHIHLRVPFCEVDIHHLSCLWSEQHLKWTHSRSYSRMFSTPHCIAPAQWYVAVLVYFWHNTHFSCTITLV